MIKTGASHAFLKSEHKDNPQVNEIIEEPKVDVNLISVELNNLNAQCAVQQSSPIYCSSCKAALTNDIVIEDNTWKCQFCSTTQRIEDKQKEGIVKKGTIDYIKEKKEISMNKGGIVVYCIDVSGSMNGSRLESCKAAICEQVKLLKETNPEKMVCVIEFESNVSILGDCTKSPLQINSRMMDDFDSLVDIGKEKVYLDPISVTGDRIIKNVQSMHTKGSTALGPALLLGTVIAGKEVGGQVILCTDGCANQGLGSMCCNEESYKPFYERVTQLAKDKGVIININTISGCNSNLKVLGETAAETYGEIIVVDSSKIYSAFDDALDKKLIANGVSVNIFLHPSMFLDDNKEKNIKRVVVGIVLDDSTYGFKYHFKPEQERKQYDMKKLPIQIQIEYQNLTGESRIRIINQEIIVTSNVKEIQTNDELLQTFYMQQTAQLARKGKKEEAKRHLENWKKVPKQMNPAFHQDVYDDYGSRLECFINNRSNRNRDNDYARVQMGSVLNPQRAQKFKRKKYDY